MVDQDYFLNSIKKTLQGKDPSAEIILFGSRARGTPHEESDWDILVLLNKEKISWDIKEDFQHSMLDLELETGQILSIMVVSKYDFDDNHHIDPFYKNVLKDRIRL